MGILHAAMLINGLVAIRRILEYILLLCGAAFSRQNSVNGLGGDRTRDLPLAKRTLYY